MGYPSRKSDPTCDSDEWDVEDGAVWCMCGRGGGYSFATVVGASLRAAPGDDTGVARSSKLFHLPVRAVGKLNEQWDTRGIKCDARGLERVYNASEVWNEATVWIRDVQ